MTRTTGIHITGQTLRLTCLETTPVGLQLVALSEASLSAPLCPTSIQNNGVRLQLANEIRLALQDLCADPGEMIAALGGGFSQLRRVPLEIASDDDRREHMIWEASQALVSPVEAYQIDFFPSGRVAFWVAVRKTVLDLCQQTYGIDKLQGFVAEPLALFHAATTANLWKDKRQAAVLLAAPWITLVAADEGLLTTAQTVRAIADTPSQDTASSFSFIAGSLQRWIFGEITPERKQSDYHEIFLCGEPDQAQKLAKSLSSGSNTPIIPFDPFVSLDTQQVPDAQRRYLNASCGFGVAIGLACWKGRKILR